MPATKTAVAQADPDAQAGPRQRAQAAVQESMDRRDNGGDAAAADN